MLARTPKYTAVHRNTLSSVLKVETLPYRSVLGGLSLTSGGLDSFEVEQNINDYKTSS
jgi:hypothetical protein